MAAYFIGLMSGTSLDGVDAALVDCQSSQVKLIASYYEAYPKAFRQDLAEACNADRIRPETLGTLDARLGIFLAECSQKLLKKTGISPNAVMAIGSHGHTLHHNPTAIPPYSLQIGDPNRIAALTGITTIADFRRRDVALGGQGAPLVPAFHQAMFQHPQEPRVIVNIGGIANITLLPANPSNSISGFDTGPGNALMDLWVQQHKQQALFDENGDWAASGSIDQVLLQSMLNDAYFSAPSPKSTGKEYFSASWLQSQLNQMGRREIVAENVQNTLCHLTAISIADAIQKEVDGLTGQVYVCGGGVHNHYLLELLQAKLNCPVSSTQVLGVDPDWVEAMAFAWLASQTLAKQSGNVPAVTGASSSAILGGMYF